MHMIIIRVNNSTMLSALNLIKRIIMYELHNKFFSLTLYIDTEKKNSLKISSYLKNNVCNICQTDDQKY